jgi:ribosome-associated translation inhibitor RaiA
MPFRVSGKNIDIGEALRTRVTARVAETLAKYFDGGYSGHVTVGKDGFGFRTECVIHLDSGVVLEVEAFAPDAYAFMVKHLCGGDRIDIDIAPAKALRMAAIQFRGGRHRKQRPRSEAEAPDAVVSDVPELKAAIEALLVR